jgi:hypothetical protein
MGLMGQPVGRVQVFLTNFDPGGVDFDRILGFPLPARETERPGIPPKFQWLVCTGTKI